jgi:hypothetical protein
MKKKYNEGEHLFPNVHSTRDVNGAARSALVTLRGPGVDIDGEVKEIQTALLNQVGNGSIEELLHGPCRHALIIAACLMVFQQFSGVNAVIFYSHSVFLLALHTTFAHPRRFSKTRTTVAPTRRR